MEKVELSVDDIYFSQDSINCKFNSTTLQTKYLGEVLDEIIDGRRPVEHLLKDMSVAQRDNRWYTVNNRNLWVLKQLKLHNKVNKVTVNRAGRISNQRFTTRNGGIRINLRCDPRGIYKMQAVFWGYPGPRGGGTGFESDAAYFEDMYDSDEEYD